jgi:hypothetical protein
MHSHYTGKSGFWSIDSGIAISPLMLRLQQLLSLMDALMASLQLEDVEIVVRHSFDVEQEYLEEMATLGHSQMTLFSSLEFNLEKECCWTMQCLMQPSPQPI